MNTRLCILIESVQPLIRKETEEIPLWVQKLHLEGIYSWFKKDRRFGIRLLVLFLKRGNERSAGRDFLNGAGRKLSGKYFGKNRKNYVMTKRMRAKIIKTYNEFVIRITK